MHMQKVEIKNSKAYEEKEYVELQISLCGTDTQLVPDFSPNIRGTKTQEMTIPIIKP